MRYWHDREYKQIIHSPRWADLRRRYIREHPMCEECWRRGIWDSMATEVHHKRPITEGRTLAEKERLAFDWNNLQSLCHACHLEAHRQLRHAKRKKEVMPEVKDYLKERFGI